MKIAVAMVENVHEARESLVKALNAQPGLKFIAECELLTAEAELGLFSDCGPDVVLIGFNLPETSGIQFAGASGYHLKNDASECVLRSIIDMIKGGARITGQIAWRIEDSRKPVADKMAESRD